MKYENFLANLGISRTTSGKGKGVRCNIALYMYPDGHSNFYFLNDKGSWITYKNKPVSTPTAGRLETVDIFIDILNAMYRRARKIK